MTDEKFLNDCVKGVYERIEEINNIYKEIDIIKLAAVEEKWGVKVGSIVKDGYGRRYSVTEIDLREDIDDIINIIPDIWAKPIRADGSLSIVQVGIGSNWSFE
jgi:hypothetical protein